jgi:hypothetical protein
MDPRVPAVYVAATRPATPPSPGRMGAPGAGEAQGVVPGPEGPAGNPGPKEPGLSGTNATTGRVDSAIDDVYGDSTAMVIKDNNISLFRTAMQISAGQIDGNYIHDPGYIAGDHTNGIVTNGGTEALTIEDNTVFISLGQTDAISLDAATSGAPEANKTIENNFLAGGGYSIYGGDGQGNTTSAIVIKNNQFGQLYYAKGGQFGPDAYFSPTGTGNVWLGNIWDTTGQAITSP